MKFESDISIGLKIIVGLLAGILALLFVIALK